MLIRPHLSPADNRRIQAMLLGNQNGDLRQQLLDGAPFLAELTHTAVPQRAAPGTTATFTRATTATFTDFEGVLRTAPAGCARFVGARFVRNLFALGSENFTTANWTKVNGAFSGAEFTASGASSGFYQAATLDTGRTFLVWAKLSCESGTVATGLFANGVPVSPNPTTSSITVTTTPTIFSLTVTTTSTGSVNAGVGVYNAVPNGSSITVHEIQLEDITGRADQTTPSEYVSVGVLSAPYHGAGADGCQFFDTDLDGNPLTTMLGYKPETAATNYIAYNNDFSLWTPLGTPAATQNAVGPNGQANYAWTLTDNDAAGYEGVQTVAAFAAGAAGCFSVLVAKKASSPSYPGIQFYHNTAGGATTAFIINEVAGTMVSFGTVAATAYGCVSYNEDFWLVWCSNTQAGGSLSAALELYAAVSADGSTPSAAGQGSTAFSEAQFEQGTTHPSSRIATAGAAVTRNADQLYYTGGDIANIKSVAARGTLMPVGTANATSKVSWALSDGSVNNYACVFTRNNGMAKEVRYEGYASGAHQWIQAAAAQYVEGVPFNTSTSFAINDVKMAKDGIGQTPDTTAATMPTITRLEIGMIIGAFQLNGNVGPIYGWTRNLSQSELNAVTA